MIQKYQTSILNILPHLINYKKFTTETTDNKINETQLVKLLNCLLVKRSNILGFIDNTDLDKKTGILATKAEFKAEQDKIVKLQAFDSSFFRGNSHFEDDGTQNYLVFQPIYRDFKKIGNVFIFQRGNVKNYLPDESIKPPATSDNSLAPSLNSIGVKPRRKFNGQCV